MIDEILFALILGLGVSAVIWGFGNVLIALVGEEKLHKCIFWLPRKLFGYCELHECYHSVSTDYVFGRPVSFRVCMICSAEYKSKVSMTAHEEETQREEEERIRLARSIDPVGDPREKLKHSDNLSKLKKAIESGETDEHLLVIDGHLDEFWKGETSQEIMQEFGVSMEEVNELIAARLKIIRKQDKKYRRITLHNA